MSKKLKKCPNPNGIAGICYAFDRFGDRNGCAACKCELLTDEIYNSNGDPLPGLTNKLKSMKTIPNNFIVSFDSGNPEKNACLLISTKDSNDVVTVLHAYHNKEAIHIWAILNGEVKTTLVSEK